MWTVSAESVDSAESVALLRDYFAELTVRYFQRATSEQEIDQTLVEFPSAGLARFLVLRADGAAVGCLGVHPTGELTRLYVAPQFRRAGGARALLAAVDSWGRGQGLTRLFLDTRADLVEARGFYASCGFVEVPVPAGTRGPFQDHWFEKALIQGVTGGAVGAQSGPHPRRRQSAPAGLPPAHPESPLPIGVAPQRAQTPS